MYKTEYEEGLEQGRGEGQIKGVISFISGLLIGGLLIWVFGDTPPQTPPEPLTPEQMVIQEQVKTEARCLSLKQTVAMSGYANSVRAALIELETLGDKCK